MKLSKQFSKLIFDRSKLVMNKEYAALHKKSNAHRSYFDLPLVSIINKLTPIKRNLTSLAFIGPNPYFFLRKLDPLILKEIKELYVCDHTKLSLDQSMKELNEEYKTLNIIPKLIDEENWEFKEKTLDGIVSNMQMHWINYFDSTLHKFHQSLKPDGLLIFSMMGANTLNELKLSFVMAEQEREGGTSPVIAPMISLQNMGDLLDAAGFRIVTTDMIRFAYEFNSMFNLMQFLQLAGESNVLHEKRQYKSKDTFIAAAAVYQSLFNKKIHDMTNEISEKVIEVDVFAEEKGKATNVVANFEVMYGIGWKEPRKSAETELLSKRNPLDLKKMAEELRKTADTKYGSIDGSGNLIEK
jgi:NADH dehydrogenase [ubiquinone] 1 alpha subcomplex assembly factor 5